MGSPTLTLDMVPEKTAVTANPAAGTLSVDVKTFTGRGYVSAIQCSCVADANVATRLLVAYKISGGNSITIATGASFTAGTTGYLLAYREHPTATLFLAPVDFGPNDILRIVVTSGQAGDDLSAITYSYKETPI